MLILEFDSIDCIGYLWFLDIYKSKWLYLIFNLNDISVWLPWDTEWNSRFIYAFVSLSYRGSWTWKCCVCLSYWGYWLTSKRIIWFQEFQIYFLSLVLHIYLKIQLFGKSLLPKLLILRPCNYNSLPLRRSIPKSFTLSTQFIQSQNFFLQRTIFQTLWKFNRFLCNWWAIQLWSIHCIKGRQNIACIRIIQYIVCMLNFDPFNLMHPVNLSSKQLILNVIVFKLSVYCGINSFVPLVDIN